MAVPVVVNLLKRLGVVTDGTADQWHRGLQLGIFTVVGAVTGVLGLDFGPVDTIITQVAEILAKLLELGFLFKGGPFVYDKVVRTLPVVGGSFHNGIIPRAKG